VYGNWIDPG